MQGTLNIQMRIHNIVERPLAALGALRPPRERSKRDVAEKSPRSTFSNAQSA